MQKFAMSLLAANNTITPASLESAWADHKGHRLRCASRDNFGNCAAAYQCLYRLESKGFIVRDKRERWPTYLQKHD